MGGSNPLRVNLPGIVSKLWFALILSGCDWVSDKTRERHFGMHSTMNELEQLAAGVTRAQIAKGVVPSGSTDLYSLLAAHVDLHEDWLDRKGATIKLVDYWGRPIAIRSVPGKLHLISFGPDGIDQNGGGDDIVVAITIQK